MPMLDLLAIGDGKKSLTAKEHGFQKQWKLQFSWIRPIIINGLTHVKCIYCERFWVKGPLRKGKDSRNLQQQSLNGHSKSTRHYYARTKWLYINGQCKPLPQHVSSITEGMKTIIITVIKFMCFIVLNCLLVSSYTSMCNFAKGTDFGGLLGTKDYATFANAVSRREFVITIAQHIESNLEKGVRNSPCFSLLLNESTNRALESYFIVYLRTLTSLN